MILPPDHGPEDYLSWVHNPMTQAFIRALREDRAAILESWGRGQYTGETLDQTSQLNAMGLAQVKVIDELLLGFDESVEEARQKIDEKNRSGN